MKLCALTMVYRDYWALTQWYRHYAALLGPENLYVVIHGADDSIKNICPNANLIHVPRDDFTKFDKRRANLLNGIANGLRAMFDWVIRVDADELICFDPARYSSLQDMFEQSGGPPALFALGLNLVEMPDDTDFDTDIPMRVQRSSAAFSGHYSKAFATSGLRTCCAMG